MISAFSPLKENVGNLREMSEIERGGERGGSKERLRQRQTDKQSGVKRTESSENSEL